MVFAYFAFRLVLSRRRQKRLDRVAMSEQLFEDLDLDGSGEINRHELLQGLRMLGHTQANESTAMRIMDLIDLDRSGGIDKHEFVAWMEHNVSQIKMGMVVLKILFGLTQILSRQPETMKEDFPGAHWEEFKLFSFDFSWTMPVCGVNYWIRWASNALLLPALLLGLVWISWRTEDCCSKRADAKKPQEAKTTVEDAVVRARMSTMMRGSVIPRDVDSADGATLTKEEIGVMFEKLDNKLRPEQLNGIWNEMDRDQDGKVSLEELERFLRIGDNDGGWDERKANIHSDYYFAFFLCYPTMTQTFFSHFNCRSLSDERKVLEADYSIECATASTEDGMWWLFVALLSAVGIALVSIGVPVLMWWKMRSFFKEKQDQTRQLRISQVVAYRDFHRQFGYVGHRYTI
jgi:Ca2+-binding EF-hand superfamily protein